MERNFFILHLTNSRIYYKKYMCTFLWWIMQVFVTFERPYPKDLIAEAQVSGIQIYLVASGEQREAKIGEEIIFVFPSPKTDLVSFESVRKPKQTSSTTYQPIQLTPTNEQSFWKIPYNYGGIMFHMTYDQKIYVLNISISRGVISKFECSLQNYGAALSEKNIHY